MSGLLIYIAFRRLPAESQGLLPVRASVPLASQHWLHPTSPFPASITLTNNLLEYPESLLKYTDSVRGYTGLCMVATEREVVATSAI